MIKQAFSSSPPPSYFPSLCRLPHPFLFLLPAWGHEWRCFFLLSSLSLQHLCATVSCQLGTTPPWIRLLYLLDLYAMPNTSKSGHRDLCRLCSWHGVLKPHHGSQLAALRSANKPNCWGTRGERQRSLAHQRRPEPPLLSCHLSQLNNFSFNVIACRRWEFPLPPRVSVSAWRWLLPYNFGRSDHNSWQLLKGGVSEVSLFYFIFFKTFSNQLWKKMVSWIMVIYFLDFLYSFICDLRNIDLFRYRLCFIMTFKFISIPHKLRKRFFLNNDQPFDQI